MPTYRVELSKTSRAGCQAPTCKNDQVKIEKGELRQGVLVTIDERDSWKYRHWGCVTPDIVHKWNEVSEGDLELIDGLDELPDELQEKVKQALQQGHVDDDDWKGDLECNRWTGKRRGMFLTAKEKEQKAKEAAKDDGDDSSPSKKPAPKKRGRKAAEADDEDEKPAPKKAKAKATKKAAPVDDSDDEPIEAPKPKKAAKSKKAVKDEEDEEETKPVPKSKRVTKSRAAKEAVPEPEPESEEEPASKKKAKGKGGRKPKKAAASADE